MPSCFVYISVKLGCVVCCIFTSSVVISPLQQYRCMSLADPIMAMVKGVVICQMCSMKKMGISPHPYWRNSECCLICGEHVVFKEKKAHYCVFHGQGGVIQKCCICDMIVHMPKDPSAHFGPQYGKLCQFCSIGHKAKQCTFLKLN